MTANKNDATLTYGCIDSLTFKTNDGFLIDCNARASTLFTIDNRPADSPYLITFTGT